MCKAKSLYSNPPSPWVQFPLLTVLQKISLNVWYFGQIYGASNQPGSTHLNSICRRIPVFDMTARVYSLEHVAYVPQKWSMRGSNSHRFVCEIPVCDRKVLLEFFCDFKISKIFVISKVVEAWLEPATCRWNSSVQILLCTQISIMFFRPSTYGRVVQ